ncbi:hypothetical protein [Actinoplanes nipponensis]|uniref:Uncharacterized protein n=1 Tax=Actinoplanes nipponensis TaxID=135950 RepID=A0A919MNN0_9ACTN|nr:hypothetical protein [Actinoplanes nipponensis]GIE51142.1 hypothetical protein Ani05nite_46760 [Actinoplanes nipponensis]
MDEQKPRVARDRNKVFDFLDAKPAKIAYGALGAASGVVGGLLDSEGTRTGAMPPPFDAARFEAQLPAEAHRSEPGVLSLDEIKAEMREVQRRTDADETPAATSKHLSESERPVIGGHARATPPAGEAEAPPTGEQDLGETLRGYLTPALTVLGSAAVTEFLAEFRKELISLVSKRAAEEVFGLIGGDHGQSRSREPRPAVGEERPPEPDGQAEDSADFTADERRKLRRLLRAIEDVDHER